MLALIAAMNEQLARSIVPDVRIVASLEEGSACPATERTPAVMELENLAQEAARELGFEVKGASTGGASDASFAAAEAAPVLDGLGPIGGLDHGPDEYIDLNSIAPRTALLAKLIVAISHREKERSDGDTGSVKSPSSEGIEHLWVIYHDYSGRACAKTVPKEGFASVLNSGVVFARANLDFNLQDHMAPGSMFLAETGDFLAVPDPISYAPAPYREATPACT